MSIVIDASAALAWLFEDEASQAVDDVFDSIAESNAVVPVLWLLEVANGLRAGIRRGRIDITFRDNAFEKLARLPIEVDKETNAHAWKSIIRLSDRYGLTPYDAAYLELAQRRRLPLATLDQRLNSAAANAGVETGLLN